MHVRMYADDTNLTFASSNTEELFSSLTHDLSNLKQWLDSNRLSLNVLKTKCLFTGTRYEISLLPIEPYICLDGHLIERVNSYKCLGVQVDETLSWEAHISEVVGKVAKVLAALRRLRPICPQSILPYLFGYKPISAISRDPKLLTQKINLINTNCKCIILGYKPRAIFGLEVYRRP